MGTNKNTRYIMLQKQKRIEERTQKAFQPSYYRGDFIWEKGNRKN